MSESGTYRFTFTNTVGCSTRDSFTVRLADAVELTLPKDLTVPECTLLTLDAGLSDSVDLDILWFGDFDICADCVAPTVFVDTAGTVTVSVLDLRTGCRTVDSTEIRIIANQDIFVPNAFSPNGDGTNDFFTVYSRKPNTVVQRMAIFDRWGNDIFSRENFPANDSSIGWGGQGLPIEGGDLLTTRCLHT